MENASTAVGENAETASLPTSRASARNDAALAKADRLTQRVAKAFEKAAKQKQKVKELDALVKKKLAALANRENAKQKKRTCMPTTAPDILVAKSMPPVMTPAGFKVVNIDRNFETIRNIIVVENQKKAISMLSDMLGCSSKEIMAICNLRLES